MSDDLFAKFANWLMRINQSEEIPADLFAFNFGLFQTPISYSIYLIGAKEYGSDDEWACEEDFAPAEKNILNSRFLSKISIGKKSKIS